MARGIHLNFGLRSLLLGILLLFRRFIGQTSLQIQICIITFQLNAIDSHQLIHHISPESVTEVCTTARLSFSQAARGVLVPSNKLVRTRSRQWILDTPFAECDRSWRSMPRSRTPVQLRENRLWCPGSAYLHRRGALHHACH